MSSILEQLKRRAEEAEGLSKGFVLALIVSVLFSIALALALVWLNMEQRRLSYNVHSLQRELDAQVETLSKLEVERNFLISPQELSKRAAAMGLRPALPGEIRRMEPVPAVQPQAAEE